MHTITVQLFVRIFIVDQGILGEIRQRVGFDKMKWPAFLPDLAEHFMLATFD
jgi:hypothetical protein